MPQELPRAFEYGIAFDASAIAGFGDENRCDLLLHPDAETLALLPWRPEHGKVVRMFTHITYPDGTPFECDTRSLLKKPRTMRRKPVLLLHSAPSRSFTCSTLTKTESRRKSPMMKRVIWILLRRIGARIYGVKYA